MKRVPEREAAKAAGERFYKTGKPCRNGHISKRYTGTGNCAACATKNTLAYQARAPEHPARIAARAAGETHYSTGKPCKQGHDQRYVSSGVCVECGAGFVKRYLAKRPGIGAKWARDLRAKDPAGHRKASMKWWRNNRERAYEALKKWKAANIEHVRAMGRAAVERRRTRIACNGGSFTVADIEALHAKQNGRCAVCPASDGLEIDHVLPIILGGSSDPSNLQLLCLPCNRSKGSKHPDQWRAELR